MPEGDTVHKVAARLRETLVGRVVQEVRVRPGPRAAARPVWEGAVAGRRVEEVSARGKHLIVAFEGGRTLRSHLGLHGTWHRYDPGEPWSKPAWQASLVIRTERDVFVCFHAREVEWVSSGYRAEKNLTRRVGPDLLAPGADPGEAVRRARTLLDPDTPLVDVLLDQRVAAGIGNVYKSEVLFLCGGPPDAPLDRISDPELRRLFETARDLMARNLGGGPRTTRFAEDNRGRLWVYGRSGRPCLRCGASIRFARLGRHLRSTYWCPRCQHGPVRREE